MSPNVHSAPCRSALLKMPFTCSRPWSSGAHWSLAINCESKGWEAGVDGSLAIAKWGAGKDINTQNPKDPIVGFVFSNKGLMAGISIEGSKITKLDK